MYTHYVIVESNGATFFLVLVEETQLSLQLEFGHRCRRNALSCCVIDSRVESGYWGRQRGFRRIASVTVMEWSKLISVTSIGPGVGV